MHVLYQPGDEKTWGGGIAVQRTVNALVWLDHLFGRYTWPQLTNVHRIEGGGTEFPMMVHDGSADLDLIRRRIDAAALLFKVRVMSDELRQREGVPDAGSRPQTSTRKIS